MTTPTTRTAPAAPPAARRPLLVALALLTAAALLLVGGLVGKSRTQPPPAPGDDSAAAGFARDMSVHHGQAVGMAMALLPRTEDPLLLALASDTALTQQAQIGRMQGWLVEWDLPRTGSAPAMAWMAEPDGGHAGHGSAALLPDGRMPGMASAEEVSALRTQPVREAEVAFLRLMTTHHRAGVAMARAALERVADEDVRALAESMVAGQQSEIDLMADLLAERGAAPPADQG